MAQEERETAQWVAMEPFGPGAIWRYRCSKCGVPQDYPHNYCPNCGAKMEVEE